MEKISRDYCVFSGNRDMEPLFSFRDFPVFMGCTSEDPSTDLREDMSWWISKGSGSIQLDPVLPLDVVYKMGHGSGSTGELWIKHHAEFAKFVIEHHVSHVLEIGGGHGILSKNCFEIDPDISWTIVEPNPAPVQGVKARFVEGFFDDQFKFNEPIDAVVHSHVFEHMYEPDTFMKHLSGFIQEGGFLIFSIPNMAVMLERKYTNCINFEHTVFLTDTYVEFLLKAHGFLLVKKQNFMDDHSIFYAAKRLASNTNNVQLPENIYSENKKIYEEYISYHKVFIQDMNRRMSQAPGKVYLFGAHVFAQYLISFGLDVTKIECILDNDRNKSGKRLYGTNLTVQMPKVLRGEKTPWVILKAGVYNSEIKDDIIGNINPLTLFLE